MTLNIGHLKSLLLIVGVSGAGKSSAMDILSDFGFFVVDNLPVPLFAEFIDLSRSAPVKYEKSALLLNIDSDDKVSELQELVRSIESSSCRLEMLYLDCDSRKIINRYNETRRPHPGFSAHRDTSLEEAVDRDKDMLLRLKQAANLIIDTTSFNIHDLKRELKAHIESFSLQDDRGVRVNLVSFGFKHGLPPDCNLIADVRFLPNPYFVEDLRDKTGLNQDVSEYVLRSPQALEFIKRYADLLGFLLPQYVQEGKFYLNIGIGCTGGRHRSVAVAEELLKHIDSSRYITSIKHRDVNRSTRSQRE